MPRYQKPKKGNPRELTVNQHVFPKRSIDRFANDQGRVSVRILHPGKGLLFLHSAHRLTHFRVIAAEAGGLSLLRRREVDQV